MKIFGSERRSCGQEGRKMLSLLVPPFLPAINFGPFSGRSSFSHFFSFGLDSYLDFLLLKNFSLLKISEMVLLLSFLA